MEPSSEKNSFQRGISHENSNKDEKKFEGFDFLRAIFSISIVAYKTKLFYIPTLIISSSLTYALSDYVLSGILGAIAVPVFLQISLFIFDLKSSEKGFKYFVSKRLPRIVSLYLFWVILITLYDLFFVTKFSVLSEIFSSFKQFILFLISGHNTPYFFFFFSGICDNLL
ncbi:MAG: hypothetical protein HC852_03420 [Acaryochloridaceae cyanobacterium RU_4_10]|nr:hypothetical protein [Acaryochloridaceae cyanobacterium RU_4_10]